MYVFWHFIWKNDKNFISLQKKEEEEV